GLVQPLGDQAVKAGAFEAVEPVPRFLQVLRVWGDVERFHAVAKLPFQARPALHQRPGTQILTVHAEQVESDESGRRLLAEHRLHVEGYAGDHVTSNLAIHAEPG